MKKYYEKLFFSHNTILYYSRGKHTEIGSGLVNSK